MSIIVFTESSKGAIKKAAKESVYYASKLGQSLGVETVAVSLGEVADDELASLGNYGVGKVLSVKDKRLNNFDSQAYSKVIAAAFEAQKGTVLVLSNDYSGKAIAPRLSVMLKAGLVAGAIDFPKIDGKEFIVKKNVFSGKAFADYVIHTDKKIISIMPNSFPIEQQDKQASVEPFSVELNNSDFGVKVKEVKQASGKIPLTEAEIVVSAGRGLKGPENWGMIEELAEALGAATSCSRPVADEGWRPHSEHVGQTGITVRPNLYIAIGISGAIQHLAGVNGSKVMVVINKDPEAPFFKAADYGIVGDAFKVVPKLIEAVKKL